MKLLAVRGRQYLVGDPPTSPTAKGYIYDDRQSLTGPTLSLHTLLAQGYWSPPSPDTVLPPGAKVTKAFTIRPWQESKYRRIRGRFADKPDPLDLFARARTGRGGGGAPGDFTPTAQGEQWVRSMKEEYEVAEEMSSADIIFNDGTGVMKPDHMFPHEMMAQRAGALNLDDFLYETGAIRMNWGMSSVGLEFTQPMSRVQRESVLIALDGVGRSPALPDSIYLDTGAEVSEYELEDLRSHRDGPRAVERVIDQANRNLRRYRQIHKSVSISGLGRPFQESKYRRVRGQFAPKPDPLQITGDLFARSRGTSGGGAKGARGIEEQLLGHTEPADHLEFGEKGFVLSDGSLRRTRKPHDEVADAIYWSPDNPGDNTPQDNLNRLLKETGAVRIGSTRTTGGHPLTFVSAEGPVTSAQVDRVIDQNTGGNWDISTSAGRTRHGEYASTGNPTDSWIRSSMHRVFGHRRSTRKSAPLPSDAELHLLRDILAQARELSPVPYQAARHAATRVADMLGWPHEKGWWNSRAWCWNRMDSGTIVDVLNGPAVISPSDPRQASYIRWSGPLSINLSGITAAGPKRYGRIHIPFDVVEHPRGPGGRFKDTPDDLFDSDILLSRAPRHPGGSADRRKKLREIDRALEEQGWEIIDLPGGHYNYRPPDPTKPLVNLAGTSTSSSGLKNFIGHLRRSGFVDRDLKGVPEADLPDFQALAVSKLRETTDPADAHFIFPNGQMVFSSLTHAEDLEMIEAGVTLDVFLAETGALKTDLTDSAYQAITPRATVTPEQAAHLTTVAADLPLEVHLGSRTARFEPTDPPELLQSFLLPPPPPPRRRSTRKSLRQPSTSKLVSVRLAKATPRLRKLGFTGLKLKDMQRRHAIHGPGGKFMGSRPFAIAPLTPPLAPVIGGKGTFNPFSPPTPPTPYSAQYGREASLAAEDRLSSVLGIRPGQVFDHLTDHRIAAYDRAVSRMTPAQLDFATNWYPINHRRAQSFASQLSTRSGQPLPVHRLTGMTAALSAQGAWDHFTDPITGKRLVANQSAEKWARGVRSGGNMDDAALVARILQEHPALDSLPARKAVPHIKALTRAYRKEALTTTDSYISNAVRIWRGVPPADVLNGPKTRNFYNNLTFPHTHSGVTVDRWDIRAATGHPTAANAKTTATYLGLAYSKTGRGGTGSNYHLYADSAVYATDQINARDPRSRPLLPHQLQSILWSGELLAQGRQVSLSDHPPVIPNKRRKMVIKALSLHRPLSIRWDKVKHPRNAQGHFRSTPDELFGPRLPRGQAMERPTQPASWDDPRFPSPAWGEADEFNSPEVGWAELFSANDDPPDYDDDPDFDFADVERDFFNEPANDFLSGHYGDWHNPQDWHEQNPGAILDPSGGGNYLDDAERDTLHWWTTAGGYEVINRHARALPPPDEAEDVLYSLGGTHPNPIPEGVRAMDKIIRKAPPLDRPLVVHRQIGVNQFDLEPGDVFTDHGYVATMIHPETYSHGLMMHNLGRSDRIAPTHLEILLPKGTKAAACFEPLPGYSDSYDPLLGPTGELVLPRGSTFKVVGYGEVSTESGMLPTVRVEYLGTRKKRAN